MAKDQSLPPLRHTEQKTKLPKLPSNSKINKRPLLHPPIASKLTGSDTQKCVYISPASPFVASVKRVRAFLEAIDRRENPLLHSFPPKSQRYGQKPRTMQDSEHAASKDAEEVIIKGTGRAIDKVLQLALYFQSQHDCKTVIRTGSVGAVDDIQRSGDDGKEFGEDESRIRRVSCLEVAVSLTG